MHLKAMVFIGFAVHEFGHDYEQLYECVRQYVGAPWGLGFIRFSHSA